MTSPRTGPPGRPPLLHVAGFLASGAAAFSVDAIVLEAVVRLGDVPVLPARLASISAAMVVGWLCHRRLTFGLRTRPTIAEYLRYASVAWLSVGVNYGLFVAVLLALPATNRIVALAAASLVAAAVAYLGMRLGVFRRS